MAQTHAGRLHQSALQWLALVFLFVLPARAAAQEVGVEYGQPLGISGFTSWRLRDVLGCKIAPVVGGQYGRGGAKLSLGVSRCLRGDAVIPIPTVSLRLSAAWTSGSPLRAHPHGLYGGLDAELSLLFVKAGVGAMRRLDGAERETRFVWTVGINVLAVLSALNFDMSFRIP